MYWSIYNLIIKAYGLLIRVSSLWSDKAKKWLEGRRKQIIQKRSDSPIWFHVSSLGEFEQARPVIERIKKDNPSIPLLLSFFSPSGYDVQKDYDSADSVFYLPLDTIKNASTLIDNIRPRALIFTKYDLWLNLIREAEAQNVSLYLISAVFRKDQFYFSFLGRPIKKILRSFKRILVQDKASAKLLEEHAFQNFEIAGDTRVDRVLEIQEEAKRKLPETIKSFLSDRKAIIAGSTWPKDEKVILPIFEDRLDDNWCVIIAPHDVSYKRIRELFGSIKSPAVKLSELKNGMEYRERFLIVDSIGWLNKLYAIGEWAYIGGGFDQGIHNTLEPAAAYIPIVFGPKYEKFQEAKMMLKHNLAFSVETRNDFLELSQKLENLELRRQIQKGLKEFIESRSGATQEIIALLKEDEIINDNFRGQ